GGECRGVVSGGDGRYVRAVGRSGGGDLPAARSDDRGAARRGVAAAGRGVCRGLDFAAGWSAAVASELQRVRWSARASVAIRFGRAWIRVRELRGGACSGGRE